VTLDHLAEEARRHPDPLGDVGELTHGDDDLLRGVGGTAREAHMAKLRKRKAKGKRR